MTDILGTNAILAPVVALVAWSLIMMLWLYAVRFPAMKRKGINLKGRVGSKTGSLEGVLEDHVNWKAHNYNHLMEQPTIFYAIAISLALLGHGGGISLILAWLYVAFRIAHSLVQATINVVTFRLSFFALASACLIGLTIQAILVLAQAA
jgi:hypothetical protein